VNLTTIDYTPAPHACSDRAILALMVLRCEKLFYTKLQARRGPKVTLSRFAIQPASSIVDAASVIAKHSLSSKHILPTLLRTAGSQVTPPRKSQMKTTPRDQYPVSTLPSSYWYFSTPPQIKTCWHEHPKESKRVYKGLQSRNQDSYRSANALQSSRPP
jgi:hypothetical protein